MVWGPLTPGGAPAPRELPTGTITFVLTDVEGSTRLWEAHASTMGAIMARHDELIQTAVGEAGGVLVRPRGEGDSCFAVFAHATSAVRAALRIQQTLSAEPWPLNEAAGTGSRPHRSEGQAAAFRVRTALHTGEADVRDGDYYGSAVNRCARLRVLARGGQILMSGATAALVRGQLPEGASLRDLGTHQLKDLAEPERVFQLVHPDLRDDFPPLPVGVGIHHLPTQPTPFVQRSAELQELEAALRKPDIRLVTLMGSGGIGKTRLASAVAEQLAGTFADGVWFVDLSSIRDPARVFPTIAHEFGLHAAGRRSPLDQVCDYLRTCHALMVLDNFEQVITAAPEVGRMLADCPDVKVLATSREPLRLRWEQLFQVPPLQLPGTGLATVEEVRAASAVAFFVQRARAADPNFELTDQNARTVAELCSRLDGVPLALELAAAQVRVLPPSALLSLLDDQFDVLRGPSDAPDRQQSLRATVEWSYNLLAPAEQQLFRRLSVFQGGFTLDAARFVSDQVHLSQTEALLALCPLLDKSLLRQERTANGDVRLRLLETIQRIAFEKLQHAGSHEAESIRQRHAEYFLELARNAERECWGPDAGMWLDRLDQDYSNFRVALDWLTASRQFEMARAMAVALEPLWSVRGHMIDARRWLEMLTAPDALRQSDAHLPTALSLLALLEQMVGSPTAALDYAARSVTEARRIADPHQLALTLWMMGELARARGDPSAARASLEEALALSRSLGLAALEGVLLGILARVAFECGHRREARALAERSIAILEATHAIRWLARVQAVLALIAIAERDTTVAQRLFEESIAISRALGDRWSLRGGLSQLASLLVTQGDFPRARTLLVESVELSRGQRDPINTTRCLIGFAQLAAGQQQYRRAVRLAGAADSLRSATGLGLPDSYSRSIDKWLGAARSALGQEAAEAWKSGQRLSIDEAIEYALGTDEPRSISDVLSPREHEVAVMLARGYNNRSIAEELVISPRTVEAHVAHIMAKLGVESRLQIATWAAERDPRLRENTDGARRGRP